MYFRLILFKCFATNLTANLAQDNVMDGPPTLQCNISRLRTESARRILEDPSIVNPLHAGPHTEEFFAFDVIVVRLKYNWIHYCDELYFLLIV